MDGLSDAEVLAIWDRINKYIDTQDLKGKKQSEIISALNSRIGAIDAEGKQGGPGNLVKSGFSDRALETDRVKRELQPAPDAVVVQKKLVVAVPKPRKFVLTANKNVPVGAPVRFSRTKAIVRVRGRTRNYAKKSVRVTVGSWRGKKAYWVYSSREKRLKTWGVIK